MDALVIIARLAVGGYFVWSGARKLGERPHKFWSDIVGFQIVGAPLAKPLAAFIPPLEFIVGLLFAAGAYSVLTGAVLLGLLIVFSMAVCASLARKLDNDCGCGGGGRVRPAILIRNALLMLLGCIGMAGRSSQYDGWIVLAAGALVVLTLGLYRYRKLTS